MGPITTWATASTVALAVMTGLYLDKRDDLASQLEQCNVQKLESIAEAERITREATEAAMAARLAQLEARAEAADSARATADAARREAEARPPVVRKVIRRVTDVADCRNQPVADDIISVLTD